MKRSIDNAGATGKTKSAVTCALLDIHSHYLPGIDDGSKNLEITSAMLRESYAQGVRYITATPHFYPWRDSPEDFLARRNGAVLQVKDIYEPERMPRLLIGSETAFFTGISVSRGIAELCIYGTDVLILEMPTVQWSAAIINEVYKLQENTQLTIVLAHIERYIEYQKKRDIDDILKHGILLQASADWYYCDSEKPTFAEKRRLKGAFDMLGSGKISFLGSDCHNMTTRPPNMGKAAEAISAELGESFLYDFTKRGLGLLKGAAVFRG